MVTLEYLAPSTRLLNSLPHDLHDTYIHFLKYNHTYDYLSLLTSVMACFGNYNNDNHY
jgi:hypothetical protein